MKKVLGGAHVSPSMGAFDSSFRAFLLRRFRQTGSEGQPTGDSQAQRNKQKDAWVNRYLKILMYRLYRHWGKSPRFFTALQNFSCVGIYVYLPLSLSMWNLRVGYRWLSHYNSFLCSPFNTCEAAAGGKDLSLWNGTNVGRLLAVFR